jgi:hypothetical protein
VRNFRCVRRWTLKQASAELEACWLIAPTLLINWSGYISLLKNSLSLKRRMIKMHRKRNWKVNNLLIYQATSKFLRSDLSLTTNGPLLIVLVSQLMRTSIEFKTKNRRSRNRTRPKSLKAIKVAWASKQFRISQFQRFFIFKGEEGEIVVTKREFRIKITRFTTTLKKQEQEASNQSMKPK